MQSTNNKKIIYLIIGIVILSVALGFYFFKNRNTNVEKNGDDTNYQNFNPFGSGKETDGNNIKENDIENTSNLEENSKFKKLTDFAVAGITIFEYDRPLDGSKVVEPIKILIDSSTKDGKKEIQTFLNKELSLNPALKIDGVLGKASISAIKSFQKTKTLPETGMIDEETNKYFYKLDNSNIQQTEKVEAVKYVEKATGHIYQIDLDKNTQNKVSNSTIPQINEVLFSDNAKSIIYRYLSEDKTISSYLATMGATSGNFLPSNIIEIATSPTKDKVFYLVKNEDGVYGTIRNFIDGRTNSFFNSSFTEWLIDWDREDQILLTTKPSWSVNGSLFALNINTGTMTKILGGIKGFTTTSNKDNSLILYSSSTNNGPKLNIFNIDKHTSLDLDTYGLADKCVWSNDGVNIYCAIPSKIVGNEYPDAWYQGLVSFDDFFVKINSETGEKETLANSINKISLDGVNLLLNKDESKIFFINKKDNTFWSLDLK
ncbi:TPA: peptidoglycan-binding protein [Candidatus Nomurabacteria bacterium]|nr:MAG: hypothetical protein O210_OD1C00001G0569 [Parcubacteria bacterium RAAC4_OD1_1]HCY26208.1 peptidoglycan-binding protein [Candidatus Nomurabacteria bacterium]